MKNTAVCPSLFQHRKDIRLLHVISSLAIYSVYQLKRGQNSNTFKYSTTRQNILDFLISCLYYFNFYFYPHVYC